MDIFFDINLINQNFIINEEEYKLLLQLFVVPLSNTPNRILILSSKKHKYQLKIVAWDLTAKKIFPIMRDDVRQVVYSIKKISFPEDLQESISKLSADSMTEDMSLHFEMLSEEIEILINSGAQAVPADAHQIELEFNDDLKLIPILFVYGAFDGLHMQVCFELKAEQLSTIKNWGILSPVRVHYNGKCYGEFFAQNSISVTDEIMSFECEPKIVATLERRKTGWMKIERINPLDLSDFLVSSAGLYNTVAFPDDYPNTNQWYIVVIPITGIFLEKNFGIGNVQFCTANNEEIMRVCDFSPKLSEYDTFALVNVNSDTLYHAFVQAKKQIEQAVDLLVNILKDDSLYSVHSIGSHLLERNNDLFEQKITLPSWVYIEIPFNNGKFVCNLTEIAKQDRLIVSDSFSQIQHELNKIELLLLKANGTNDKELTPLFNSLKWIRRAWDADDFDDKVIYSIIALEFIVSKEPNSPLMDKPLRKKCKGAIRKIINDMKDPLTDKVLYSQQVCDKFERTCTETPFMGKLRNLIERLDIPVSSAEMDLIVKARKQRNEIVHGENDSKLPTDEIYRLCECIGKIAFYKLLSLEE